MRLEKKPFLAALLALVIITGLIFTGCAKTTITGRQQFVTGPLPRPGTIWVYDFTATAADLPANSQLAGQADESTLTAQEIATGRELGAQIATRLVEEINKMGMPAMKATAETVPQINDIVLRGHLISMNEGSTLKRVTIGFGAGASKLSTAVEGFQMTATGLRPLGMGEVSAGGGKTPGAAVGAATLLATANPAGLIITSGIKVLGEASGQSTVDGRARQIAREIGAKLKNRFQEQGWISQ